MRISTSRHCNTFDTQFPKQYVNLFQILPCHLRKQSDLWARQFIGFYACLANTANVLIQSGRKVARSVVSFSYLARSIRKYRRSGAFDVPVLPCSVNWKQRKLIRRPYIWCELNCDRSALTTTTDWSWLSGADEKLEWAKSRHQYKPMESWKRKRTGWLLSHLIVLVRCCSFRYDEGFAKTRPKSKASVWVGFNGSLQEHRQCVKRDGSAKTN